MIRFQIVIFNFEKIHLFLDNFYKIRNFDKDKDQIVIVDCSKDFSNQKAKLIDFIKKQGYDIKKNLKILRRNNWGIDQGGRIDYFLDLYKSEQIPKYIWQFQDHYLDLDSPKSRWPENTINIDGKNLSFQYKADTIPDNFIIDLNQCENIFDKDKNVGIIFANRLNIGIFKIKNQGWLYTDGANLCMRTKILEKVLSQDILLTYKSIFDNTYTWSLFIEFDFARKISNCDYYWYDLVNKIQFKNPDEIIEIEKKLKRKLHQENEKEYVELYQGFKEKFDNYDSKNKFSKIASMLRTLRKITKYE